MPIERHRLEAEVVGEAAHRQRLDRSHAFADAGAAIRYVEDGHFRGKAVVVVSRA